MARFSKGLGYHTIQKKRAIGMYHTTGFSRDEVIDLCVLINSAERGTDFLRWPPILGLFKSVAVALTYMRHNRTQAEIGESFGVSQPTISRAIKAITPLIAEDLAEYVSTAEELGTGAQYIVDGTLLPCWSWAAHPELYSGKHKTTGMKVQVACTFYGKLAWISDPVNGSRHDNYGLGESGVLLTLDPGDWIGDKGYVGNNMRLIHRYDMFRKIYLRSGAPVPKMARFSKGLGYHTPSRRNEPSACIIPRDSAVTR